MTKAPQPAAFRRIVDDSIRLLADSAPATEDATPQVEDMTVCIHRGTHEIGRNWGKIDQPRQCAVRFSDLAPHGVDR